MGFKLLNGRIGGRTRYLLIEGKRKALKKKQNLVFFGKNGIVRIYYNDLRNMSDNDLIKLYNDKRGCDYDNN